jgi:hypothetical protein
MATKSSKTNMSTEKRELLKEMLTYIREELDGKAPEGTSFTSALINTVDTAAEGQGDDMTYKAHVMQPDRELTMLRFIMGHRV